MKASAAARRRVACSVGLALLLPATALAAVAGLADAPVGPSAILDGLLDPGIRLVASIQGWGRWLESPMRTVSFLGEETFFLLALPLLYWCVSAGLGIRVGLILLASDGINNTLKLAFHGPRPYWYSAAVTPLASEGTFGVPSGHSQNAAAVWGMLAARLARGWAWAAAIAVVSLIGLSRLYLAAHFPHDVLFGWTFGFVLLWLFARGWDRAAAWIAGLGLPARILLAFGASACLIASSAAALLPWRGWSVPPSWAARASAAFPGEAIDPLSLSGTVGTAALLFGLASGLAWIDRRGGYDAAGPVWQRASRFVVGLAGLVAIYAGLKAVLPEGPSVAAQACRYLRYAAVGLWVSAVAPMVFARMRLASARGGTASPPA